jgi:hypothetical protein
MPGISTINPISQDRTSSTVVFWLIAARVRKKSKNNGSRESLAFFAATFADGALTGKCDSDAFLLNAGLLGDLGAKRPVSP